MVSQLYLMWGSLLSTLETWMNRHNISPSAKTATLQKLKTRRNNNWHAVLPLAYFLDPLYAQTATGAPGPLSQKLFGSKKLSTVSTQEAWVSSSL